MSASDKLTSYEFHLLGTPAVRLNGCPIEFPTRKASALCVFLAANGARAVDRQRLSGLLWGSSASEQARGSLRKAISLLRAAPLTRPLLECDRAKVWLANPVRSDLSRLHKCLTLGSERSYREALDHWSDEPLIGLEVNEPTFDEWVASFRRHTVGAVHRHLVDRLALAQREPISGGHMVALCELIVRVDPSDTSATERLIALYMASGDWPLAMKRYRAFSDALGELDAPIPKRVRDLIGMAGAPADPEALTAASSGAPEASALPAVYGTPAAAVATAHPSSDTDSFSGAASSSYAPLSGPATSSGASRWSADGRPVVAISLAAESATSARAQHVRDLLVGQLTQFCTLACREEEPLRTDGRAGADTTVAAYRIVVHDDPSAAGCHVRCLHAGERRVVTFARVRHVDLSQPCTETAIATIANALVEDVLHDTPRVLPTPFATWLRAQALFDEFTAATDARALALLEELVATPDGATFGLAHASIASALVRRRVLRPGTELDPNDLARATDSARRSVALDPYAPYNRIALGWTQLQCDEGDRAIAAFEDAVSLNRHSSRTLMAAAGGHAFCGKPDVAATMAARALQLAGRCVPSAFHGHLAAIAYVRGELEECVVHLARAPQNVQSALLAVATHHERGDEATAAKAKLAFVREVRRAEPDRRIEADRFSRWLGQSSMLRCPRVRERMFSSLHHSGLSTFADAA